MLDEKLLEILACPVCKRDLEYNKEREILICKECSVFYEIREGIPVLLPDSGKPLEEDMS